MVSVVQIVTTVEPSPGTYITVALVASEESDGWDLFYEGKFIGEFETVDDALDAAERLLEDEIPRA